MTPGERITIITKVASALAEREWADVDLILETFGFPTSDQWSGDQHSYVVAHVKNADDLKLLTLHGHLFPGEAPSPPGPAAHESAAAGLWEAGYFRLFISHSSKQRVEVGELKTALRAYGIDGFVAHDDIEPTKKWQETIETALHSCEAFVAYLTGDFHGSLWTDQEVGVALGRGVLIIPIRKGDTPYGFMGKYQALPGANKFAPRLAEDVAVILAKHELTDARYNEARSIAIPLRAVEAIENANTYDEARAAFKLFKSVPEDDLTDALLDRIEKACKQNSQLKAQWAWGSTTVADEASAIVDRVRIPF
jgi:hypothetical protein